MKRGVGSEEEGKKIEGRESGDGKQKGKKGVEEEEDEEKVRK